MEPSLTFGPAAAVPPHGTAHGAVLAWADRTPDAPALRAGGRTTTYRGLVGRAREVASRLVELGLRPGEFVPVSARPGEAFAVAALGVLLAGAAFAAVDPRWPAGRLADVAEDLGARFVLDATGEGSTLALPVVKLSDGEPPCTRRDFAAPRVGADDPACVFFTSGSTGRPKGVVIPHRAMIRTFVDGGYADFGPDTVMPLLAAPYWDAGALETFGPLLNGGCAVEARDGLLTPAELRRLVREDGVNTLWLTSSLANLILDEEPGAFAGVRHLMTGGERVSPPHLAAFLAACPRARLTNGYGPVESMVFVTAQDVTAAELAEPDGVPVGRAVRNTLLAVVGDDGAPLPRGRVGELWVGGDGLALGYLDRPEEEARRFGVLDIPGRGPERVYRTGDLVRMAPDGRLSYVGRADRQFKLRGYRIEPGEVERAVAAVAGVQECFLVPVRTAEGTVTSTVCGYTVEPGRTLTDERVRGASAAVLAAHLRPDRFVRLASVPLGPTGKADLRALERLLVGEPPEAAPTPAADGSPALSEVRRILGDPALAGDDDLLADGVNSLQVLRIAARLSRLLDTELSAGDVYRHGTVDALEREARRRPPGPVGPTGPAGDGGPTELSAGERRFWIAERLAPGAPGHVAVSRIEITGPVDGDRLERALAAVAAAHPALRTTFPQLRGRPHRAVAAEPALPPLLRRSGDETAALPALTAELAARVHDLVNGPLLAAGLLSHGAERHTLVLAVHHTVYDGHSEQVLLADLAAAWSGVRPRPAPAAPTGPVGDAERHRAFWRAELAGLEPLDLPGARPVTMKGLWTAPVVERPVVLPPGSAALLRAAAARLRRPALAVPLAAWWRALSGWSGRLDFAVGVVVADRAAAHERTIGFLANSLPVRIAGTPGASGPELTGLIGERLLEVFEHAALPTDEIAALVPRPPGGRSPLFQTMLVFQRVNPTVRLGGSTLRPRPAPPLGAQGELVCELWEDGDDLVGSLQAPAGLLPPAVLGLLTDLLESELTLLLAKDLTKDLP
ncbi:amino acid adenylation domain-containing protein [Kitasatospora sp. NPDC059747]|uniref:amino acid adenylation domain-containing protein n=1 Tax=Kitasatospora sp. NPDC059747 TaxID=3346930 RepID=UPI00364D626D